MAGLLTHLSVVFGGVLLSVLFWNWKYGLSFGVGHLIPDLLDFGIAGIAEGSLNPRVIMTNPLFRPLAVLGHTFTNWIILGLVVLGGLFLLFKFDKISKKKLTMIILLMAAFLVGVLIHVVLDVLIIETNHWI
jgi:hypothetical protein